MYEHGMDCCLEGKLHSINKCMIIILIVYSSGEFDRTQRGHNMSIFQNNPEESTVILIFVHSCGQSCIVLDCFTAIYIYMHRYIQFANL